MPHPLLSHLLQQMVRNTIFWGNLHAKITIIFILLVPPINGGHDVSGVSSGVNGAGLPSKAFGIGMTLFNVAMMIASTVVLYEKF